MFGTTIYLFLAVSEKLCLKFCDKKDMCKHCFLLFVVCFLVFFSKNDCSFKF